VISQYFPDPEQDYKLNLEDPAVQDTIEKLEVHIDAIKPVWRENVGEWFEQLDPDFKVLMHPIDAGTPPTGPGWIIQIACHHYNPYPSSAQLRIDTNNLKRTDFGPIQFLTDKVLPKLNDARLRFFGVHHVAVAWLTIEKDWTTEKGKSNNNLASSTVPMLDRASPPAAEGGGGAASSQMGGPGGMGSMVQNGMASQMSKRSGGNQSGMESMMRGQMRNMMGGMAGGPMGGSDADLKKQMKTLTRTDFLIQFVWQPVKPEEQPKTVEEREAKLKEKRDELTKAEEKNPAVRSAPPEIEKKLEDTSRKKSEQFDDQMTKAMGAGAPGTPGAPGAPGAPGMAPPVSGGVPGQQGATPKPQ
jgi:type IV pilus assembly protein PilM